MKKAYTYDKDGVLTGTREVYEDPMEPGRYPLPVNCTFEVPPSDLQGMEVAHWTGKVWEKIEDHRRHLDNTGHYVGGTEHWLPAEGDDYQSEGRYVKELGPLPEGAVLTKPEKPQSVIDKENAETELYKKKTYMDETQDQVLAALEALIPVTLEEGCDSSLTVIIQKRAETRTKIAELEAKIASL